MPKEQKSELLVTLRIVLVDPPTGVDFGIQEGKGNGYKTIAIQRSKVGNLQLDGTISVKGNPADGLQALLALSPKAHRLDVSSTLTSENLRDKSTVVGSVESRFLWKQLLGK